MNEMTKDNVDKLQQELRDQLRGSIKKIRKAIDLARQFESHRQKPSELTPLMWESGQSGSVNVGTQPRRS
jgi:hypothetical protein